MEQMVDPPLSSSTSLLARVSSTPTAPITCQLCSHREADVVVAPCGCRIHARCIPIDSLCTFDGYGSTAPVAVASNAKPCPACRAVQVTKFTLLPLSTDYLDEGLQKRKDLISQAERGTAWHMEMQSSTPEIQAENHYLLVLRGHSSSVTGGDTSHQRTGRWTSAEVALTDFLVQMFDDGRLPMEQGIKLSDFLSEVLLCKSSRLSKKMKNSQLGTRSYNFRQPVVPLDGTLLSQLIERFIHSISSEPTRYELQFNISKFWRTRLSNLALEMHQPSIIDVSQWIAGLEVIEQKAAAAQERIRMARRRRLGMADCSNAVNMTSQTFPNADPTFNLSSQSPNETFLPLASSVNFPAVAAGSPVSTDISSEPSRSLRPFDVVGNVPVGNPAAEEYAVESLLPQPIFPIDAGSRAGSKRRRLEHRSSSLGPDDDISESTVTQSTRYVRSHCGPFLTQLMNYVESRDLPFQHADVWVPSYSNDANKDCQGNLKLFHAGYVTRNDLEWRIASKLDKFGKDSCKTTFFPGHGLPGRVFWSGQPEWERALDCTSPDVFIRVDLAHQCGVKSGFCFPLASSVIGKICVAMYSVDDLPEDQQIMDQCVNDLGRLCPEPKWKLVVEVPASAPDFCERVAKAKTAQPVEKRIATLLGDHMPLSDLTRATPPTEAERKREAMLPHFLSLRLLLLRQQNRLTAQDKEHIQLIVDSFQGYDTGRRSDEDLAFLIVRDWIFLVSPTSSA